MRGWLSWLSAVAVLAYGLLHAAGAYSASTNDSRASAVLLAIHLVVSGYGHVASMVLLSSRHRSERTRQVLWSVFAGCIAIGTLTIPIAGRIEHGRFPTFRMAVASLPVHLLWAGIFVLIVHARTAKRRALDRLPAEHLLYNTGAALGGMVAFAIMFSMLFWPGRGLIRRMLAVPVALGLHVVGSILMGMAKIQQEKFATISSSVRTPNHSSQQSVA
jgi:hypothetical protein